MTAGLCQCGCGRQTKLAPKNHRAKGWVKGKPLRYLRGHHATPPVRYGTANNRFNGGLCFNRTLGRWVIVCRDGSLMLFYRGVMAAQFGRLLTPTEIVHHVNGDPTDDRPENLAITTRAEHMRMHRAELDAGRRATA